MNSLRLVWRDFATALAVFVIASCLNLWLARWIGYQAVALVYLLAVVLLALAVGRGAILFGTGLSALGWNYLFVPPKYSFHIAGFYDKMMLAMYFVVALTVGQLTALLRAQRLIEQQREKDSTALFLLTRELADSGDSADIVSKAIRHAGKVFNAQVAMLLPGGDGSSDLVVHPASTWVPDVAEQRTSLRVFEQNRAGDAEINGIAQPHLWLLPLTAGGPAAGVLGLRTSTAAPLAAEQRALAENFARQIALVLDRQRLRDQEVRSSLLAESERLSRTLLNSVSHELRTPLAAITTAANTLRNSSELTSIQQKLAVEIEFASDRLNRVVEGLLSAARLQSGQLQPQLDWCDISDLVKVALRTTSKYLSGHAVQNRVPPGLPLVKADFVLLEQALGNLLMNAAAHTPPGTPVEINARIDENKLLLEVADRGPGIPRKDPDQIFELFHRAPTAKPGGTGLGLAIVKGFVEAQGGTVRAANRSGGGALFSLSLPAIEIAKLQEERA